MVYEEMPGPLYDNLSQFADQHFGLVEEKKECVDTQGEMGS